MFGLPWPRLWGGEAGTGETAPALGLCGQEARWRALSRGALGSGETAREPAALRECSLCVTESLLSRFACNLRALGCGL